MLLNASLTSFVTFCTTSKEEVLLYVIPVLLHCGRIFSSVKIYFRHQCQSVIKDIWEVITRQMRTYSCQTGVALSTLHEMLYNNVSAAECAYCCTLFEYNAVIHCKRFWSPPVSGSGCTDGRKNWSWVKALWDGAKTNTYIHHTVVFRRSLRLNRRQQFVSSSSIRLWIQFMGFVFIKSFLTFHYHSPRQATLKGHSMNFTHKGQFTRYGAWTNSCVMSSVVLVGACYKITWMLWTACGLHWGCEVKMTRAVNTLRHSNERSCVVVLQEFVVSSVFWPGLLTKTFSNSIIMCFNFLLTPDVGACCTVDICFLLQPSKDI